eukprot:5527273-Amphidinium_carterae.2
MAGVADEGYILTAKGLGGIFAGIWIHGATPVSKHVCRRHAHCWVRNAPKCKTSRPIDGQMVVYSLLRVVLQKIGQCF